MAAAKPWRSLSATCLDVSGRTEGVAVYTTMLRNGDLFYLVGVAPREEFGTYQRAFDGILRSVQLND